MDITRDACFSDLFFFFKKKLTNSMAEHVHQGTVSVDTAVHNVSSSDLIVVHLIAMSDKFDNDAKNMVTQCSTPTGLDRYFRLKTLAIKALVLILRRYQLMLDPKIKVIVLYKLSTLYFEETTKLEACERYLNEAILLATKHNYLKYQVLCEILLIKLLKQNKEKELQASRYLENILFRFKDNPTILVFFLILKHQTFNSFQDRRYVKSLLKIMKSASQPLSTYILLLCAYSQLSKGELESFDSTLCEIDPHFDDKNVPIQLKFHFYLLKLYGFIAIDAEEAISNTAKILDTMVQNERLNKWRDWNDNGEIKLEVFLHDNDFDSNVSFTIFWLNPSQIMGIYSMLIAISILNTYRGEIASKPLNYALKLMNTEIKDRTTNFENGFHSNLNDLSYSLANSRFLYFNAGHYLESVSEIHDKIKINQNQLDLFRTTEFSHKYAKSSYEAKRAYSRALKSAKNNNLDDALRSLGCQKRHKGLVDDTVLYSLVQHVNLLKWKLDLASQPGYSHNRDSSTISHDHRINLGTLTSKSEILGEFLHYKAILNNLLVSTTKIETKFAVNGFPTIFRKNKEGFYLVKTLLLFFDSFDKKNDIDLLKSLDLSKFMSPYIKILLHIVCAYKSLSMSDVDERIEDCIRTCESLGDSDSQKFVKLCVYRAKLHFIKKRGLTTEMEEIKLKIIALDRELIHKPLGYSLKL